MNITIRQFEVITTVAETKSFTKAAEALGVSQPTVSETVRRVEQELGFAIFERNTRQLNVSAKGRRVVISAREAIKTLRFAMEGIADSGSETDTLLTIAALPSVVCTLMPQLLREFHSQYPNVRIDVLDADQEEASNLVLAGHADLAIVSLTRHSPLFHYESVATDQMHLICRFDDPLAELDQVPWAALNGRRFINLHPSSSVRRHCDSAYLQTRCRVEPVFEVSQIPSAAALVAAGLGITALPEFTLPMFSFDDIRAILLVEPVIARQIGVLQKRNRRQLEYPARFIEHLKRCSVILNSV